MDDLKPCPFCGDAKDEDYAPSLSETRGLLHNDQIGCSVYCPNCGIEFNEEYADDLIEKWNTRPASPSPASPSPAIKPLAWDDFDGRGAKAKVFYDASYLITKWSTGKFELAVSYPGHQAIFAGPQFYDTLDAAKAAAQADYEARIALASIKERDNE